MPLYIYIELPSITFIGNSLEKFKFRVCKANVYQNDWLQKSVIKARFSNWLTD